MGIVKRDGLLWRWARRIGLAVVLHSTISCANADPGDAEVVPTPPPRNTAPMLTPGGQPILSPQMTQQAPPELPTAPSDLRPGERPLPINLATALRLANARPLVIQAAEAGEAVAAAEFNQAKLLWLPNVNFGGSFLGHVGANQGTSGTYFDNNRNQYLAGYGAQLFVSSTDAIFAPLAARQVVQARNFTVQAARNDALLSVSEGFFNVQQARGRMAGAEDAVAKAQALVKRVKSLSQGLVPPVEVNRVQAALAGREQAYSAARGAWGTASADLTRALRLDPSALAMPIEAPFTQVTLISPEEPVDSLIPIGLLNRPELASQRQLVQATLVRLRQERMRPLMPSLLLQGAPVPTAPGGYLMGGIFGSTSNGSGSPTQFRNDVNLQLLWGLENLGFGNRALVRERAAEQQQQAIELFRVQDTVAAEVASAHADLVAASERVPQAETEVKQAQISFAGNMRGVSETTRFNDILTLVNRPSEVVLALDQLASAYDNYFAAVNDYNRAQFRLFRALGYPANILAFQRAGLGAVQPVDVDRLYPLPPVCGGMYEQNCR